MKYTEVQIKEAAKFNSRNKKSIQQSIKCACYYCCRVFDSREVTEYFTERVGGGETALCPYCKIDTVIPGNSNIAFTEDFLNAMRGYWFDIPLDPLVPPSGDSSNNGTTKERS